MLHSIQFAHAAEGNSARCASLGSLVAALGERSLLFRLDAGGDGRNVLLHPDAVASALDICAFQTARADVAAFGPAGCLVTLNPTGDGPITDVEVELARRRLEDLATEMGAGAAAVLAFSPGRAEEERERLSGFNEMLEALIHERVGVQFQPILDLHSGQVAAYEALARIPQSGRLKRSGEYFQAADQARIVAWLDLAYLRSAFAGAARERLSSDLFVNVVAEGLSYLQESGQSVSEVASRYGIAPRNLVVELTERQAVPDFPALLAHLSDLRQEGVRIAIDDAGEGYSSLGLLLKLRPDVVKIERAMVRSVDTDGPRRAVLEAMVRCAREVGAEVVAEGIETLDELRVVVGHGIRYGQGYRIGRPADDFRGARKALLRELAEMRAAAKSESRTGAPCVREAARAGTVVEAGARLAECERKFRRQPELSIVAVTDNGRFLGLIGRADIESVPRDELETASVAQWARRTGKILEAGESLASAARLAARGMGGDGLPAVILENGQYVGLAAERDLLEALARNMPE